MGSSHPAGVLRMSSDDSRKQARTCYAPTSSLISLVRHREDGSQPLGPMNQAFQARYPQIDYLSLDKVKYFNQDA